MPIGITQYYTQFKDELVKFDKDNVSNAAASALDNNKPEIKEKVEDKTAYDNFRAKLIELATLGEGLESLERGAADLRFKEMNTLRDQFLRIEKLPINSAKMLKLAELYHKHLYLFQEVSSSKTYVDVVLQNDKKIMNESTDNWCQHIFHYRTQQKLGPVETPKHAKSKKSGWGFNFFTWNDTTNTKLEIVQDFDDFDPVQDVFIEQQLITLFSQTWPRKLYECLNGVTKGKFGILEQNFQFLRKPITDNAKTLAITVADDNQRTQATTYVANALRTAISIRSELSVKREKLLQESYKKRDELSQEKINLEQQLGTARGELAEILTQKLKLVQQKLQKKQEFRAKEKTPAQIATVTAEESVFDAKMRADELPLKVDVVEKNIAELKGKLDVLNSKIKDNVAEISEFQNGYQILQWLDKVYLLLFCAEQQYYILQLKFSNKNNRKAYLDVVEQLKRVFDEVPRVFTDTTKSNYHDFRTALDLIRAEFITNTLAIRDKLIEYSTYVPHTDSPLREQHSPSLFLVRRTGLARTISSRRSSLASVDGAGAGAPEFINEIHQRLVVLQDNYQQTIGSRDITPVQSRDVSPSHSLENLVVPVAVDGAVVKASPAPLVLSAAAAAAVVIAAGDAAVKGLAVNDVAKKSVDASGLGDDGELVDFETAPVAAAADTVALGAGNERRAARTVAA